MNKQVSNSIEAIRNTLFGDKKYHNYAHSITLNGWLIVKPTIHKFENNIEIVGFLLYQISKSKYECYRCQAFSKKVIEEIKGIKNVSLINCLGRLVYKNKNYFIQVEEIIVSNEFSDIPLSEMEKENKGD